MTDATTKTPRHSTLLPAPFGVVVMIPKAASPMRHEMATIRPPAMLLREAA